MAVLKIHVPWDKSWVIRMGVRDLLAGKKRRTLNFLETQESLNEDLIALATALFSWTLGGIPVDVGESGTLYRFLRFASWKLGRPVTFIRSGTLKTRQICDDSSIVNLPQRELLKLDNGTSQWASAAVLCGDQERLSDAPYKLQLTYVAVTHWEVFKESGWIPRRDRTIERQADAFNGLFHRGQLAFKPEQAEDFCFAYAFCGMSAAEGLAQWPSLLGHESNRIDEMGQALLQAKKGEVVQSRDHRVVQAVAMWCVFNGKPTLVAHPGAVNKSWPQFWEFLKQYQ